MNFNGEISQFPDSVRQSSNGIVRPIANYPSSFQFNKIKKETFSLNGANKGLRSLSYRVKKIIESDSNTTYKQVAEKLLAESQNQKKDEANVRRRVYDALNVLIAADVIVKQKKYLKATDDTFKSGKCLHKDKWRKITMDQKLRDTQQLRVKLKKQFLLELMNKTLRLRTLLNRNNNNFQSVPNSQSVEGFIQKEEIPQQPFPFSQQSVQSQQGISKSIYEENKPQLFNFPVLCFWQMLEDVEIQNKDNTIVKINSKKSIDLMWDADILQHIDQTLMSKIFDQRFLQYIATF